jgi:hypothetical protein
MATVVLIKTFCIFIVYNLPLITVRERTRSQPHVFYNLAHFFESLAMFFGYE